MRPRSNQMVVVRHGPTVIQVEWAAVEQLIVSTIEAIERQDIQPVACAVQGLLVHREDTDHVSLEIDAIVAKSRAAHA